MSVGNELDINTLSWVKSEIDETLSQAGQALEAYVEDPQDESRLQFCLNYLHQVSGTLQMVELYGAAMVSEDMEQLVGALLEGRINNRNDAYEVLMHGVLQLPDYLEHLLAGNKDLPVVLLPLLNDLRAARGASLLSENALFSPDLSVTAPVVDFVTTDISQLARKLRHSYHLGLLGWFRDKESDASLKRIFDVIEKLRDAATEHEINRLLWVAGGLVESLRQGGVDSTISTKLLLGQLDRQIKRIIDNGLTAFSDQPPHELLKNLLYYVATSQSQDERTREVKKAFRLHDVLPDTRTLEQARADLAGPNEALMGTVSKVLLEDLVRIKDTLDVFVRKEDRNTAEFTPLCKTLAQMADTLGMMGLGVQRKLVHDQISVLESMTDDNAVVNESALMDVAAAMLSLEASLQEATLARAANEQMEDPGKHVVDAQEKLAQAEQHQLLGKVIEESKSELNHVKEALNEFSRYSSKPDILQSIPAALDKIRGSLSMLNLSKASELLQSSGHYIQIQLLQRKIVPDTALLDDLADAISSIEYYLESLVGKWGHPEAILSIAENSVARLLASIDATVADEDTTQPEMPIPAGLEVEDSNDETLIDIADLGSVTSDDDTQQNLAQPLELLIDPESSNGVEDEATLNDITLNDIPIADIENANPGAGLPANTPMTPGNVDPSLNTDDSQQITLNDISLSELQNSQMAVPGAPESDVEEFDLSFDQVDAVELTNDSQADMAAAEVDFSDTSMISSASLLETPEDIDDEILEIFIEEAEGEYQNIGNLLQRWQNNRNDEEALKDMRRSFHTLKGSGRLVGANDVGEFAWAFENMLNRVMDNTVEVTAEMFELLYRGKETLPQLLKLFKQRIPADQRILVMMGYANDISQGKKIKLPEVVDRNGNLSSSSPASQETARSATSAPVRQAEAAPAAPTFAFEDSAETSTSLDVDPVLLDIYLKEVAMHLDTLRSYVADWNAGRQHAATDSLLRALHTLTGSSRTTGVDTISDVCSIFEKYIKELQTRQLAVNAGAIEVLQDSMQFVADTARLLNQADAQFADNSVLVAQIENLFDALQAKDEPLEDVSSVAEIPRVVEQSKPSSVLSHSAQSPPARDYDDELLEIFVEEGEELLDESDKALTQWLDAPENNQLLEAMQRQLHTLKGGARMAGVTEIGDLGHSVESLLTALVDKRLTVSKKMFTVLQRAQDQLVSLLEQVKFHHGLVSPDALIAEIEALTKPDSGSESLAAESDVAVSETDSVELLGGIEVEEPLPEFGIDISEIDSSLVDSADGDIFTLEAGDGDETLEFPAGPFVSSNDDLSPLSLDDISLVEDSAGATQADESLPQPEASLTTVAPIVDDVDDSSDNVVELPPRNKPLMPADENSPLVAEAPGKEASARAPTPQGQVRVRAELLDTLVNFAGEVSIYRSRMEQQSNTFRYNLRELDDTVSRLRHQLREFEIETEAQIQYRKEESLSQDYDEFDPLEFDRFTHMQQLSRGMLESLNDLDSLRTILANITRESETLLLQQARVNTELQEGLMRTRMVPFSGQAPRLRRIVRQTSQELAKNVDFRLLGMEGELDRTVLDRIMPAIEHMLRNAVAHGIESPQQRSQAGKPAEGVVELSFTQEGSDVVIRVSDDGAGFNLDAIQKKAIEKGLLKPGVEVPRDTLLNLVLESGFSTAETITQIAGRGVGMDVVSTEIKQLGGLLNIDTAAGKGTTFTINMPLSLAITRALMVHVGEDTYAIPLLGVQAVERIEVDELLELQAAENPVYTWLDEDYQFLHLGSVMGTSLPVAPVQGQKVPLLLIRSGEHRAAIQVESLIGSREVVVKPVGPQLSTLRGVAGATIMGDGQVVLILDLGVLIRLVDTTISDDMVKFTVAEQVAREPMVMVVDDSITVRKVTTRLLERHKYQVVTAKDGVDALALLQDIRPDIMLLDVEMPRMDGYELAINVRNDKTLKDIPIIMITSRTAEKHRRRAMDIGVNVYMGKPFNETELLESIRNFVSN